MKMLLIKWLLPLVMDLLMQAAANLARRTSNTIDDEVVAKLTANKDSLVDEIKRNL